MRDVLKLSSYDYDLPPELIAKEPIMPRSRANLLVFNRKNDEISHLKFGDLAGVLPPCAIIFNDTKVVKARIYGQKESGGKIEMLLNQPLGNSLFSAFIKGSVKVGTILSFENGLKGEVTALNDDGSRVLKITQNERELETNELFDILESVGHIPLPPYIKRDDNKNDEHWYQSVFARHFGAVAAPTASLHFDDEMISKLSTKHEIEYITLHVGAGTFKGVECENIMDHKIHSEFFSISQNAAKIINSDEPLLAVGTTVARTAEYFVRTSNSEGACDLFLHPNNPPSRVNFLLTNFHLPKSTLIMLVASFIGLEKTLEIYKIAVEKKYRFFSYGDAMLII